jgi:large subunit ribosomal protein L22
MDRKTATCILKYLRISPRKVGLVLETIRRKNIPQAKAVLANTNKKAARFILNALNSAAANAKVLKLDEKRLFVSEAKADAGPTLKRFLTRSMGRADRLLRRTCHITVTVKEGRAPVSEPAASKTGTGPKQKKETPPGAERKEEKS